MQAVLTWAFFLQLKVMTFLKVMSIPMVVRFMNSSYIISRHRLFLKFIKKDLMSFMY